MTQSPTRPPSLPSGPVAGPSERNRSLNRQLRWIVIAWMFGSLWMWTISGAAMTQFARGLGLPDAGFGVLAALPFIGTLFQLPGSWVQERFGRRKLWFIVNTTISRLLWVAVALIPWVVPESVGNTTRWGMLLALVGLSWVTANLAGPAFMSWFGDIVPRRIRGRYMGVRNSVTLPLALGVTLGVGAWLKWAEATRGEDMVLIVTSIVIGTAGVVGALDILCFMFVSDPKPSRGRPDAGFATLLIEPWRHANFRKFVVYNFTLMLAIGFLGQYTWLFVFDVAHISPLTANLMLIAVPLVLRSASYPLWGRLVDRLGKKPVILIAGTMISCGPMGWLLVTPELIWPGYLLTLIGPMAWPGIELANFNFMLEMTTEKKGQKGGTSYVAVNSIVSGIGGVVSGMIGATIAAGAPDLHYEVHLPLPWLAPDAVGPVAVVTYHGLLFVLSALLCFAALIWATTLHETRAAATRDALRYMTSSLYSNVRQGTLISTRVVGQVSRQTYRLNPRKKKDRQ